MNNTSTNTNIDQHRIIDPGPENSLLKIMGLNAQKWPDNKSKDKILHAHILLDKIDPDLAIILETATIEERHTLSCSDKFSVLENKVKTNDVHQANGKGIAILHKKELRAQIILPALNNNR